MSIIVFLLVRSTLCLMDMSYLTGKGNATQLLKFLSLHPLCGGGDLLFLLSPPAGAAAATCFCSHSKTPTRSISKYLQYAYWPWGICLVNFFLRLPVSSTKSKMAAEILWHTLELEPLHRFVSCLV